MMSNTMTPARDLRTAPIGLGQSFPNWLINLRLSSAPIIAAPLWDRHHIRDRPRWPFIPASYYCRPVRNMVWAGGSYPEVRRPITSGGTRQQKAPTTFLETYSSTSRYP